MTHKTTRRFLAAAALAAALCLAVAPPAAALPWLAPATVQTGAQALLARVWEAFTSSVGWVGEDGSALDPDGAR